MNTFKNNNYKLVAVDIDGTLLNSKREITINTKNSIKEAIKKGIIFSISTGRPLRTAKIFSEIIDEDIPMITCNGALVVTSRSLKTIFEKNLTNDQVKQIIEIIDSYHGTYILWSFNDLYFNKIDDYTINYQEMSKVKGILIDENHPIPYNKTAKIIWFDKNESLKEYQNNILKKLKGVNYFTSQLTFLEFVNEDVSKALALEKLGKYYSIKKEEMIAIGDGCNDLPMINYAGLGVAMDNSEQEIKDQADFVTLSNDDDGVSYVIEKFILKEERYMNKINEFIKFLPNIDNYRKYNVYRKSINRVDDSWIFMYKEDKKYLIVVGPLVKDFNGEEYIVDGIKYKKCELNHDNANSLRKKLPFTAPRRVLKENRTFGLGDRLGIATIGHIRLFEKFDAYPVFAQQSIRELNLTNRSYEDVLDCVSYSVLEEGFKKGFGADGDHLKKASEIEYALSLGYTMITLDCSEHINNNVNSLSIDQIKKEYSITKEIIEKYINKEFEIEGEKIVYTLDDLYRCNAIYSDAISFATSIFHKYFENNLADFEISIDETETPTTPLQHFFVAKQLIDNRVDIATLAPRFCGEFQKGVDYIGSIPQFEKELKVHAAIARHFGYKLSIHSGSDKFSTFKLIGKYTNGNFHVKTAGTNWLEAMKVVAKCDPKLYREIHMYAISMFNEAKKYYHVTTDLSKIPDISTLKDEELVNLFTMNDARQLIHITYGFILTDKDENNNYIFKDRLYELWDKESEEYALMLQKHIGHHLELLYSGFQGE